MKTVVAETSRPVSGYLVIAPVAQPATRLLEDWQDQLNRKLPGVMWMPRGREMHITLLHVINPTKDYAGDVDELFAGLEAEAVASLQKSTQHRPAIALQLEGTHCSAGAVFAQWRDHGEFAAIRERFVSDVALPEPTTDPPTIVHTSLARYKQAIDVEAVARALPEAPLIEMVVDEIQLVHETRLFNQERIVLHSFRLG